MCLSLQTLYDLNDSSQSAPYQAGFVPPPPAPMQSQEQYIVPTYQQPHAMIPSFLTEDANNSIESLETSSMSDSSWHTPPPMIEETRGSKGRPRATYQSGSEVRDKPRRNVGGRKPNKANNISPEEEEKRKVRRERNKQAAARCRRRREDHTSDLQGQVDELENKKRQFTVDIQALSKERDELCEILEEHKKRSGCSIGGPLFQEINDVKPNLSVNNENLASTFTTSSISTMAAQRPANFAITISNNNNNNNNNTMNANSKLSLKIKAEPVDLYDEDEPPAKRRCDM